MEDNRPHFRRLVLIWLACSIVLTALVVFVLGPGLPPGNHTVQAAGQVTDNTVLLAISTPIALGVLIALGYELIVFRERANDDPTLEGPAIRSNASFQMWWLVITTTIVLFMAAYGSIRLLEDGAGGGQGPNPLSPPPAGSHPVQVQVIAQQWQFTYRYPGFGDFETNQLEIPADSYVVFNVTSLDVVHSFWAYQLGLKADANPGENNVAWVQTKGPFTFNIHCAELCGLFHGYMFATGKVVPKADFVSWATQQQLRFRPATRSLPPYSRAYFPDPQRRGG